MEYFNPRDLIVMHGSTLPHWQQGLCPQFITFREHGALPQYLLRSCRFEKAHWLELYPEPHSAEIRREYHMRFTKPIEDALDRGVGRCAMRCRERREVLKAVLLHAQGDKVEHLSFVIMPNHVHLLCIPRLPLEELIKVWKGTSARRVGLGRLWQANYRDTLIRNETHFRRVIHYIRENPNNLKADEYTLWESEAVQRL